MICTKEKQLRRVVEYAMIHRGQLPQTREDRLFAQRVRIVTYMKVYDNMKKQLGAKVYKRFITTNARPWRFRAIGVNVYIYVGIPKKANKEFKHRARIGLEIPTKKPDIDNIFKAIADALNGVAYADDKQIVHVRADKYYDDNPRTEVEVFYIDNRQQEEEQYGL